MAIEDLKEFSENLRTFDQRIRNNNNRLSVLEVNESSSGGGSSGRELLSADRTYYVATTGSDSNNDGLTSGNPFATIQKAWDTLATIDFNGYDVTIQLAAGTYTGGLNMSSGWDGGGEVTLEGDVSTPSNVVISTTSKDAIQATVPLPGTVRILGVKVQTTTSGNGIGIFAPGIIAVANVDFGSCVNQHISAGNTGGKIAITGNYTISGGATNHYGATHGGFCQCNLVTVTLTGTPAFSSGFAVSSTVSEIESTGNTFSGSATGPRYSATLNGVINTFGSGSTYFPGNSAGSTATGGIYA